MRSPTTATLIALALLCALPGGAEGRCQQKHLSSWHLQLENDFFGSSDEDYTNGVQWTRMIRHCAMSRSMKRLDDFGQRLEGHFFPDDQADHALGIVLGQNFFTPSTLKSKRLLADDRPYAAVLYGGPLFVVSSRDGERQHTLQFLLGWTGKEALGETVQREWHQLIGDEDPMGWDTQIPFEVVVNAIYLDRRRHGPAPRRDEWDFDVISHWGGGLGTAQTFANAGATFRYGWNVAGFPVATNFVSILPSQDKAPPKGEFWLFLGFDARLFAHNIFLDGTLFRDSHSVDKEEFVYDVRSGFSGRIRIWKDPAVERRQTFLRVSYTVLRRSREFSPLPPGQKDGEHVYGSLAVGIERTF